MVLVWRCVNSSILPTLNSHLQAIERVLRDQTGIQSVKVALLAERAVVEFDPFHWTVPKLIDVGDF